MKIDLDALTLNDLRDIEKSGGNLSGLLNGEVTADTLIAVAYVVRRKEDPEFTLEQAGDIKLTEFDLADEADPTQ